MAKSVAAVYSVFGSAVSWLQTVKPDQTELTVWMGARFERTVPLPAEREEELAGRQEAVNRTYAVFFDAGFRMVGSDVTPA
jgi:hypothetical protein